MIDTREKLIELLADSEHMSYEKQADYLIANGVVIQPDCQACAKATSAVIANLQKRIATDNNVGHKWIPVTERLPDRADTVLAVDRDGTMSTAYYVGYWHSGGYLDEDAVTHWMPLPEPPKGE